MGPIVAILLSLAAACILQFVYRFYRARTRFRGLPQPPHSFFWGHLKVMGEIAQRLPPNSHPQAYVTEIAHQYGMKDIWYLDLWPIADAQVIITNPDLMNQVQVTKPLAMHPMADDFLGPIVGRGNIATSNGPVWKKQHNAMAPAFSTSHVRNLTGVIVEEAMHFRATLEKLAESNAVFSMEEKVAELIFDVIARLMFNFSLHAQTKGSEYLNDLREMVKLAEAQLSWSPIVKAKAWFRRKVVLGRLHPSIEEKIRERFDVLKEGNIVPSRKDPFSILDLMLREQVQDVGKEAKGAEILTPGYMKLMVTNIKALLVGGHGTTTDTLCYIYMLLSKSPEVVQKLQEEHTKVFSPSFDETLNILRDSPSKLNDLEYTSAVIKEALRLFPVGFGVREAPKGYTLTHNDQVYPIDNLVVVATPHSVHYDPTYYSYPAKFMPERFLDTDPNTSVSRSCFRTFGRGARACLGQNLAMDEMKVVLLMTIREFEFECEGLVPNKVPKTSYTQLDTVFGDVVFQELGLEARPRGSVDMRVRKVQ